MMHHEKKIITPGLIAFMLLAVSYIDAQITITPSMDTDIHQVQPTTNWNNQTLTYIEVKNSG